MATDWPDGVRLVELAPIGTAALAVQALAAALALPDEFEKQLIETIERAIAGRELLLVLDNCEHLLRDLGPIVARVLRAGPCVRVLATSREPLDIAGESTWPVPPLLTARVGKRSAESESVRLFVERAQAANPGFMLTAANAPSVRRICQRLDGVPLAIELAAGTATFLAPQQLVDHIAAGDPCMGWRRPMTATIQRSVDLLTDEERCYLARLTVFSGGFSLDGAQAVCDGPAVEMLRSLVRKSLVVAESPAGEMRYRLLEPVREFACALLRASDARAATGAHAHFYLSLSREANLALASGAGGRWWPVLNLEHENLQAALQTLELAQDDSSADLVATAIAEVWRIRGHIGDARKFLTRRLAGGHVGVLLLAGQLACFQGEFEAARSLLEDCVARGRQHGMWPGVARALVRLADVERAQGYFAAARRLVHEAVAVCPVSGDADEFRISLLAKEAVIDLDEMRIEAASASAERTLPHLQHGGFLRVEAETLTVLAVSAVRQGRHARAIRLLERSLGNWQVGDRWGSARTLLELGRVMLAAGKLESATSSIAQCLQVCRDLGDPWCAAAALEARAVVASRAGHRWRAAHLLDAVAGVRARARIVASPREEAWLEEHLGAGFSAHASLGSGQPDGSGADIGTGDRPGTRR